ncbi:hypothetical protein HJFPF1_07296 [Paramyrothecium foliicola]|nr:hypothetical protein HJFPF1_07296 [Paramyrothecium foliicola]
MQGLERPSKRPGWAVSKRQVLSQVIGALPAMEPLSALGVAAGVVQFIDFGTRLISTTGQLYQSPSGRTAREVQLTTIASDLAQLSTNIRSQITLLKEATPAQGSSESVLLGICEECMGAAKELQDALTNLRKKNRLKSLRFGASGNGPDDLANKTAEPSKIKGVMESFAVALKSIVSFDGQSWRERLLDLRTRMMSALLAILWQRSAASTDTLAYLAVQQTDIVKSLARLETNTRTGADPLVQVVNAAPIEDGSGRSKLAKYLWSFHGLSHEQRTTYLGVVESENEDIHGSSAGLAAQYTAPSSDLGAARPEKHQARLHTDAIMNSLQNPYIRHREDAIPEAYKETYEWIFKSPPNATPGFKTWANFPDWLESPAQAPYWITGKPGAGKSTLTKFIANQERTRQHLSKWSGDRQLILASFYFWSAGVSPLQKSQTGLLLSALLLQCLEQMPSLCPKICPRRWALFKIFGASAIEILPEWTWDELMDGFSALKLLVGKRFTLALFVDGLDEFDGDYQKLVDFVHLFHNLQGTKILISSRPENIFVDAFVENPSLRTEDFTAKDIKTFVEGEFSSTRGYDELIQANPVEAERLVTEIVDKASGVFLWVSVVVRALSEGLREGDRLKELKALLDSLPMDLSELYSSIWKRIKPDYRTHASHLFQILSTSEELLDAITMHLADLENEETLIQDIGALARDSHDYVVQTLKRRLNSRTRGLLEVTNDGQVDYLHRSVLEWVVLQWDDDIISNSDSTFDPHLAILKALVVQTPALEILKSGQDRHIYIDFWKHAWFCFFHASKVRDDPVNTKFLAKVLDKFEEIGLVVSGEGWDKGANLLVDRFVGHILDSQWAPRISRREAYDAGGQGVMSSPNDHAFLRLAAQFGVLPYVRARLLRDPKLRHKLGPESLRILSGATFGFEQGTLTRSPFAIRKSSSADVRILLVKFLLEQGLLGAGSEKASQFSSGNSGRRSPEAGEYLYRLVKDESEFYQSDPDTIPRERKYWEEVAALFEEHMPPEKTGKAKSSFMPRFFSKFSSKKRRP